MQAGSCFEPPFPYKKELFKSASFLFLVSAFSKLVMLAVPSVSSIQYSAVDYHTLFAGQGKSTVILLDSLTSKLQNALLHVQQIFKNRLKSSIPQKTNFTSD